MGERKRKWSMGWWEDDVSDSELNGIGEMDNHLEDVSDGELLQMAEMWEEASDEQHGSGTENMPLFNFEVAVIGESAKFKKTLLKQHVRTKKIQLRQARESDNLGHEVTEAVRRVAAQIIGDAGERWPHGVRGEDQVFNFSTPRFQHPLQSSHFRVDQVIGGSDRWQTYLEVLANQLNSNESFEAEDSFNVDVTLITHGGGDNDNLGGKWGRWLGHKKLASVIHDRKCILEVSNTDQLCCARAICLAKAACEAKNSTADQRYYRSLLRYPLSLTRCAKFLHREAGVPEGPCGTLWEGRVGCLPSVFGHTVSTQSSYGLLPLWGHSVAEEEDEPVKKPAALYKKQDIWFMVVSSWFMVLPSWFMGLP
ncbi:hypothetical protein AWC38_SpisGene18300 [Stylophora pistillata]|uniref:Uncharacterized protein n=1 Tax=Stylophora pistillata TaxID=50429 RepID=A0A2B4RJL7_STYPI|nr:hypothetical protein AWC38_SpisGene18300 [Stylophora pistillata]